MNVLPRLRSVVRSLLDRRRIDREIDVELEFHVRSRSEDLIAAGWDRAAAERQARRELGDIRVWKEQGRDARGLRLVDDLAADLRHGVRWLRRFPTFTLSAVLSIAIGVGATTSMFSLANGLLLRLIPVSDPASLVLFSRTDEQDSFPYPLCRDLQTVETRLAFVACRAGMGPPVVEVDGPAEVVSGELVSGNFFEMLGARPYIGRLFTTADNHTPGAHPVVVLSFGYWQRRFGGDPGAVGQTIRVNSQAMTIVGVTQPDFFGIELGFSPDLRLPLVMGASPARLASPQEWWLQIVGRLEPGVSRKAAATELDALYQTFFSTLPPEFERDHRLTLLPAAHGLRRLQSRFEAPLLVLNGLAAILLALVCLNLANLMIARGIARAREFSIRRALGARDSRILAQLVVESLILAAAGGALSVPAAPWLARLLAATALPPSTVRLLDFGIDHRVLVFALGLCAVVAIVCGVAPAFALRKVAIVGALGSDSRQTVGGRVVARRALISAQIALSFSLLVGAGLLSRTLTNLRYLDLGFQAEALTLVTLSPPPQATPVRRLQFFADVEARVAALPGIQASSFAMMPLLGRGEWGSGLTLDTGERDPRPEPLRNAVGPRFFATVGMQLVAGREFTEADGSGAAKVAIVNESFAERYFGGAAIGRRIGTGGPKGVADNTIIGVVRNAKRAFLRETAAPVWYVPYRQLSNVDQLVLHVRGPESADAASNAIREAVASIDRSVPILSALSMEDQIDRQLVAERLLAGLSVGFAGFAIALAAVGLYGITEYMTHARTREIGLRIALGATRSHVVMLVLRQTAVFVMLGLVAGVVVVFAGVDGLRSLLFGVEPIDVTIMTASSLLVVAVTIAAAWLPARHAVRINPTVALQ